MTVKVEPSELLRRFLVRQTILIVDAMPSTGDFLFKYFLSMGVPVQNIALEREFDSASRRIEILKPRVLICDYIIDNRQCLELIVKAQKNHPKKKDFISILFTSNSTELSVARAVEEDIDGYILKPFDVNEFKNVLLRSIAHKITPSEYLKTIYEGQSLLEDGKLVEAEALFNKAKELNLKPALALYFLGQLELTRKSFDKAEDRFIEALRHNRIHFKCLNALHDLMMTRARYREAYDIAKKISYYFPANPSHLARVLRLAILSRSYDDVERYYHIFSTIEGKTDELVKYVCAALVVCGKHYLQRNFKSRAIDVFQKAVDTSKQGTKILREIVLTMLEHSYDNDAKKFFKLISEEAQDSLECQALRNLMADLEAGHIYSNLDDKSFSEKGYSEAIIFQVLIRRAVKEQRLEFARKVFNMTRGRWPEMSKEFPQLVQAPSPNKTSQTKSRTE